MLNRSPLSISRRRVVLFAMTLCWFSLLAWWHRFVVIDDPWITFRYAQNVVAGHGWVFNPGEALEGYSNFLWVVFSMVAHFANLEPLGIARVLSWVSVAGLFGFLCFGEGWFRSADEEDDRGLGWGTGTMILATCYPLAVWTMGGLETVFYAVSVCLYALFLARVWQTGRFRMGVICGGMLLAVSLTRPEAPMMAAPLLLAILLEWKNLDRRTALLSALAVFLSGYIIYTTWRIITFGTIIPNTVTAKVGGGVFTSFANGILYFFRYFNGGPLILLAMAAMTLLFSLPHLFRPKNLILRDRLALCLGSLVVMQLVFALAVGGDWMPAGRFFVPLLAPMCLLVGMLIRRRPVVVKAFIVLFFVMSGLYHTKANKELNWYRWAAKKQGGDLLVAPLIKTGMVLKERCDGNNRAVLAATEAGVMPYYSGLRFIDMLGLVDAHIAALPGGLHEKFDAEYVLGRKPDYIVIQLTETEEGLVPTWDSDRSVYEHPNFVRDYQMISRQSRALPTNRWEMKWGWLVLYERKPSPKSSFSSSFWNS